MTSEEAVQILVQDKLFSAKDAETIIAKAEIAGEMPDGLPDWLESRFLPNCLSIEVDGYARMCIDALRILHTTAPSDYGMSRQRDLVQHWADMTRGYLGEYAFALFLKNGWGIEAQLGHETGEIEHFLPTDVHKVKTPDDKDFREPRIGIGVKTTKINGIWLDIPGDQFSHAQVHVLVKVAAGRDHLFGFFRELGVFKDKVLRFGKGIGHLSDGEVQDLLSNLPEFTPIPAYIAGFVRSDEVFSELPYGGRMGRNTYTITSWNGRLNSEDLNEIKRREGAEKVKFEGIGQFTSQSRHLFNVGNLQWRKGAWDQIVESI